MKKILIIEDDKSKIEKLKQYLVDYELSIKESFQTGVLELKKNYSSYNLLILDMTIPIWEKGQNEFGNNYEQFGGERILREIKRRKLILPTILFTMFDVFPTKEGSLTFEEVNAIFKNEFESFYIGAVFYNSNEDNWKDDLTELIALQ